MKPIPAPSAPESSPGEPVPATASDLLRAPSGRPSQANRRSAQASIQQAYPWLLAASTSIAVLFGLMYINKPVVVATQGAESTEVAAQDEPASVGARKTGLLPDRNRLPGDDTLKVTDPESALPQQLPTAAPVHSRFEETNMRVQHILTATTEDGHVSRIDLEVPVLYQSRNLRWTPAEVARARELLVQLMDYQHKTRELRSQGEVLLRSWNDLVGQSIPAPCLRADSPSLPENQKDVVAVGGPLDTTTRDAIEIQPKEAP